MRRAMAVVALLAVSACPRRGEVIPLIHVDPRAAARLDLLARRQAASPPAAAARVHVMGAHEMLGGPNALGRPGDLVIENDEVVFVVQQLGPGVGFAETGGNLVDAADAHSRRDELGQMFTYFGAFPRQGVYDRLTSRAENDRSAWVEAGGHELLEPSVAVTTRYTLQAPDRALLVETRVENTGATPVSLPGMGDAIEWGGATKVAPGKDEGFTGTSRGPYVGAVGRFTSYAVAAVEGDVAATSGHSWTDTVQQADVKLGPGQAARYARVLLVGERPDTTSLVGELALAAGQPVGEVDALLPEGGALPTGFTVALRPEGASEALTLVAPFRAEVPVGRYTIEQAGAAADASAAPLEVSAGAATQVPIAVAAPASVDLRCTGDGGVALPCKVTFEGIAPVPAPSFGTPDAAGPAVHQVTTANGEVHVDLAAGRYRVTASRGPEYTLATDELALAPGDRASRTLSLARVLDTRGYVACDFHQHTMRSLDSGIALRDRVVAGAAEGVEVAVATEHNVVSDLEAVVRELGLQDEMVSLAGDEVTSDASAHPWGHVNAYPLQVDAAAPRGGAPPIAGRSAHEVIDEVRRRFGDVVVQVNHPLSLRNGYFALQGFDPKTGLGTAPGYEPSFDALEVWSGRSVDARGRVLADFLALLRLGRPVTPVADTDTHGVVGQEAGYPRTYVRVADDAHFAAWDGARSADLVRGIKVLRDVVLTNGPMIHVRAGGATIGGVARGKTVRVDVTVESAPWVEVDEVSLLRASGAPADVKPLARKEVGGVLVASASFDVHASSDDAFVVVASGSRTLFPVLSGDDAEIRPWAMTGAIWIDADGDGRALSRAAPH